MAFESQIPGGPFLNETGSFEGQIPGGPFVNETVSTGVIANATITEDGDALSSLGIILVTGTANIFEDADTSGASGIVGTGIVVPLQLFFQRAV